MITTLGHDTIKTLANGQYRAHRMAAYWIGDYPTYAQAARALQIANSEGASDTQRGFRVGTESERGAVRAPGSLEGVESFVERGSAGRPGPMAQAEPMLGSPGRDLHREVRGVSQHGEDKYDGGVHASEDTHLEAVDKHFARDLFGPSNPVTLDDVACTILAGEPMVLIAGLFPVRAKSS